MKFKYRVVWGVSNESGAEDAECCRKVASERKIVDAIKSWVNARIGVQLECARVLHEMSPVPVPLYGVRHWYVGRRKLLA